jgi:methyltransferase (TIGR00027 family)
MRNGRFSETARISAMMRAAHRLLDRPPWIFDDTWAARFAGYGSDSELRGAIQTFQDDLARFAATQPATPVTSESAALALAAHWIRVSRSGVALRGRYTEDELLKAVQRGLTQYVILGAGLDSFAYRRPDIAADLRVFEVDHPDTQAHKRARLEQLQIETPSHLTWVPMNFRTQPSILAALRDTHFDPKRPAFFSFLGVSWYLSDETFDRTLREVASAAPGSEIVLDYLLPEHLLEVEDQTVLRMLSVMAASHGEPGGTCFDPAQMTRRLEKLGFTRATDFGGDEANARYGVQRSDGLRISELLHLAKAGVA